VNGCYFIGRYNRNHVSYKTSSRDYHDLSAVRQVEIADAIASEKFPNLHQTVALLQKLLSKKNVKQAEHSHTVDLS